MSGKTLKKSNTATLPASWYKQFWPWFLIALPMTAVAASIATIIIASRTADTLVADNYYKAGLAINQVLDHKRLAKKYQITATLHYANTLLTVLLAANDPAAIKDEKLTLKFIHPTLRERDYSVQLGRAGTQGKQVRFIGQLPTDLPASPGANWYLQLAPANRDKPVWRLDGKLNMRTHAQLDNYKLYAD